MEAPSLRIAHVTATFPPYRGGTGTVCFHNARAVARRGHEVHVWTAALAGAPPSEQLDGVSVRRLRPLAQLGNAALLAGLLPALRPYDLIHLHAPFITGAELAAAAAALHGIPLVMSYHNDLIPTGTWRDAVFWLATRTLRGIASGPAARILFVSQGHAASCDLREAAAAPGRCLVVPNGVDSRLFAPAGDPAALRQRLGLGGDGPLIGFVGALDLAHHYKGLHVLLEALAHPQLTGARLLVVGDGELRAGYERQAALLGLAGRVRFHGAVAQDELPPLYGACDLVAVPSLVPESFSLTMIEALACGVAVAVADGPGVRSVMNEGRDGLLVPAGDVRAWQAALALLLEHPELRRRMGAHGRAWVRERYDWAGIGARLESVYAEVLAERAELGRPPAPRAARR